MAFTWTNRGKYYVLTNDMSAADIRQGVLTGTIPAAGTIQDYNFVTDVLASSASEATFTNYARQDLAGVGVTEDDVANVATLSATGATILSAGGTLDETLTAVFYFVQVTNDADSVLLGVDEPTSTFTTNGSGLELPVLNAPLS